MREIYFANARLKAEKEQIGRQKSKIVNQTNLRNEMQTHNKL